MFSRAAAADPSPSMTLSVEGFEDREALRRTLQEELKVELVEAGRAAEASGALELRYDAATKRVSVRYRKLGEMVVREIAAPAGEAEARRAAVLLSGNMAREVKTAGDAPPTTAPTPPVAPVTNSNDDVAIAREEARRLDGLERILENDAKPWALRQPVGAGMLVLGAGALATSFALKDWDDAQSIMGGFGVGMVIGGSLMLIPFDGPVQKLQEEVRYLRKHGADSAEVEALLEKRAATERRWRKIGSGIVMGTGVTIAAIGGVSAWSGIDENKREQRGYATAMVVGGSIYAIWGLYSFLAPGTIESSKDTYHAVFPKPQVSARPMLAPVAGGGLVGVTGTF
jgi:hypothetical protein